jgi:hypothetical protein
MRLSPDECKKLATHAGNLILADQANVFKVPKPKIFEAIESALRVHFEEERQIEEKAQKLYQERASEFEGLQPAKALGRIRAQLAQETDFVLSGGMEGRFTADKISHIAHLAADKLYDDDLMDFPDEDDGPKFMKKIFMEYFAQESSVEDKVRKKIQSLSNAPFEGSREWDILFRKYKEEELKRLGHQ